MGEEKVGERREIGSASAPSVEYHPPKFMAEIGCNHMVRQREFVRHIAVSCARHTRRRVCVARQGDMAIAKELLKIAFMQGADYAKFQKRNPKELLTKEQYDAPHPNPRNSYGETYGEHREFLEFSVEQHRELKAYCDELGLGYSCSVWDTTSAKEIVSLKPDLIKVGSPSNQNFEMQAVLRDEYAGDVHISTGMTTREEIEGIVQFWEEKGQAKRVVLYNCTSGYPVPFEDVCMLEIRYLHETYKDRVKLIGFSGHHLGIAIDVAAYALGATWFERHFTKDRTWKGTDHAASLEPTGLGKLIRDLKAAHKCMSFKPTQILDIEQPQRKKLKWGQYNKC